MNRKRRHRRQAVDLDGTVDRVKYSADGSAYAYSCRRLISNLVVFEGIE